MEFLLSRQEMSVAGRVLNNFLHCHSCAKAAALEESLAVLSHVWEGTEHSSLPKETQLRVPMSTSTHQSIPCSGEGSPRQHQDSSQALAPGEQGRLSPHPPERSLGQPRGCSEPLSQHSPGGCSGLYKLIKGLM